MGRNHQDVCMMISAVARSKQSMGVRLKFIYYIEGRGEGNLYDGKFSVQLWLIAEITYADW